MADNKVLIEVVATGKGLKVVAKDTEKLNRSTEKLNTSTNKLNKTQDTNYTRTKQGVIQTANSTKNFSKMQQSIDGGGGAGGLVRAYALLAANVFALSAAFGILSRGAQVDTLIQSMEQLEVVSGKAIKSVARDLQEAAGYGLDFANALRSTSLALSAGFESQQIMELGEVARNAAVSLGRNLPDALDRIFRGVIKVEPELLDEIGLFVRVNEAAAKYASTLGISVGDLTEFQKRQAFLNEAIEQGTNKFQVFSEVETDPFAKLQTTFVDLTQGILTFVNRGLLPVINFLAENKLLFGTIFAAVATTLLRMAVPAMGAFTQSVATNAAESARAADEAIRMSVAKGRVAEQEHKKFLKQELAELEVLAQKQRFTDKPQQLKVRGKESSAKLEAALQKEQVQGEKRLLIIKQRIADIESNRGLAARQKNANIQKELAGLKAERDILLQISKLRDEINSKQGFAGVKPGSVADRASREAAGKAIRDQGIANVATIAETQGLSAAMKALGIQMSLVTKQSKAATVSFGLLRKSLFAARGAAVIAATGFRALWMAIMGPLSVLLLILPLLQAFARFIGFGSEQAEKLSEANKEASETFRLLSKRVEHAKTKMAEYAEEGNFREFNRANAALKETTLTTIKSLDEQVKAFEEYRENTNGFVQFFGETIPALFGGGTRNKIKSNQEALIKELKATFDRLTPEMQKLIAEYERTGSVETREKIIAQAKQEAEAYKNIISAIDGARDSARAYADSLIVKTQVDKPLASFKQINAALANANLSQKEQNELIQEVIKDTAVLALLTKDQEDILQDVNITQQERLEILQGIEDNFARQQELLIRQKNELAQIKSLQNQIKGAVALTAAAIDFNSQLINKQQQLIKEGLKFELQRKVSATGLTEERIRELAQLGSIVGKEKELGFEKENVAAVQAAINQVRANETFEMEEQFRLAKEDRTLQRDKAKALLEILNTEKSLNDLTSSRLKTQTKIAKFAATGRTNLDLGDEIDIIRKQEELRNKGAKERIEAEQTLVTARFDLAAIELKILKGQNDLEILRQKRLNREASIDLARTKDPKRRKELLQILTDTSDNISVLNGVNTLIDTSVNSLTTGAINAAQLITDKFEKGTEEYKLAAIQLFEKAFPGSTEGTESFEPLNNIFGAQRLLELKDPEGNPIFTKEMLQLAMFSQQLLDFSKQLEEMFGENGAFVASLGRAQAALLNISVELGNALDNLPEDNAITKTFNEQTMGVVAAVATAVAGGLQQISSVYSQYMQQNIREIDQLIEAEKKRDGKSKESVAKLEALEKKKESMKRKEFETNKKLMLAQAVASTAAGVAGALANSAILGPIGAIVLASVIGAMGLAQIAIIRKLKYGGNPGDVERPNASLSIGQRSNRVDISRAASAGEASYLRGGSGVGSNAGNFTPAAMGRKGYADGGEGVVVGERGPEVITPSSPIDVIPNYALGGQAQNITFNINAVDGQSVQNMLMDQQGTIIGVIRNAANSYGEDFLPEVNVGYDLGGG